jgi:hypothetical protein
MIAKQLIVEESGEGPHQRIFTVNGHPSWNKAGVITLPGIPRVGEASSADANLIAQDPIEAVNNSPGAWTITVNYA